MEPLQSTDRPDLSAAPRLEGFLSARQSSTPVVEIMVEPDPVYVEEGRHGRHFNFDFSLTGLTDRIIELIFIKVAAYDSDDHLITFRYLNTNAVGPSGVETLVSTRISGTERVGLFNPFHTLPFGLPVHHLRFMFTFRDVNSAEQFYDGTLVVTPVPYNQEVELELPVRGLITVLDGHDYFSHHRRFEMNIARQATGGAMQTNFARYAIDLVHIGEDGNTRRMPGDEPATNYDFRFPDARRFYSNNAPVLSPADGRVVVVINDQPDLYDAPFDFDEAVREDAVHRLAGNYVVIQHNEREFSHLFHFLEGSISVTEAQEVRVGDLLGHIGFSGAATVYTHLHYQLMNGPDFLQAESVPARFREITFLEGSARHQVSNVALDTGDIVWAP